MTAPRDPNQLIRAFLDEGPTDLREQVYDEVRTEIDHTHQRTSFGPWSNFTMNRFAGFVAATVVIAVAVIVGLSLGGGGPLIGGDASQSPSAEASASPSVEPSAEPSDDAGEPSDQPEASDEASLDIPFTCDMSYSVESTDTGFAPLQLSDVRMAEHEGYDRVVFEYVGSLVPALAVERDEPPFVHDPSGLPLEISGSPVYLLNITGASKRDADGNLGYTGSTDLTPGLDQIAQLVEQGDFEAVNNWYLGVNGSTCLRVFPLADPGRLVIDVQHLD
jgi:hypothetical protein